LNLFSRRAKLDELNKIFSLYTKFVRKKFVFSKELADLIKYTRSFLNFVSKAKAAKLVRNLVDMFLDLEAGTGEEVS
jgi:hypothetical protein